jgi:hypothetical protein
LIGNFKRAALRSFEALHAPTQLVAFALRVLQLLFQILDLLAQIQDCLARFVVTEQGVRRLRRERRQHQQRSDEARHLSPVRQFEFEQSSAHL